MPEDVLRKGRHAMSSSWRIDEAGAALSRSPHRMHVRDVFDRTAQVGVILIAACPSIDTTTPTGTLTFARSTAALAELRAHHYRTLEGDEGWPSCSARALAPAWAERSTTPTSPTDQAITAIAAQLYEERQHSASLHRLFVQDRCASCEAHPQQIRHAPQTEGRRRRRHDQHSSSAPDSDQRSAPEMRSRSQTGWNGLSVPHGLFSGLWNGGGAGSRAQGNGLAGAQRSPSMARRRMALRRDW